jgi:hypothetical protein
MISRTLIASTVALIAGATALTSTADAGFRVGIGVGVGIPLGGFSHGDSYQSRHWRQRDYVERKSKRAPVAKKKSKAPVEEEVADKQTKPETVNENSSIAVAALPDSTATTPATTAATTTATTTGPVATAVPAPTTTTGTAATGQPALQQDAKTVAVVEPAQVAGKPPETTPAAGQTPAKKIDCKKFFPSVGLTLSVPCE